MVATVSFQEESCTTHSDFAWLTRSLTGFFPNLTTLALRLCNDDEIHREPNRNRGKEG